MGWVVCDLNLLGWDNISNLLLVIWVDRVPGVQTSISGLGSAGLDSGIEV